MAQPATSLIDRRASVPVPPWLTVVLGVATTLLAAILLGAWSSKASVSDVNAVRYEHKMSIDSIRSEMRFDRELQLDTFCALKPQDRRCVTSRP